MRQVYVGLMYSGEQKNRSTHGKSFGIAVRFVYQLPTTDHRLLLVEIGSERYGS